VSKGHFAPQCVPTCNRYKFMDQRRKDSMHKRYIEHIKTRQTTSHVVPTHNCYKSKNQRGEVRTKRTDKSIFIDKI